MRLTMVGDAQDICRLACEGDFTLEDLQGPSDPLEKILGPNGFGRKVLLNLERATYLDSCGVGRLIHWQHRFAEAGGMLVLHSIPTSILYVLKLLQMERVLKMAADEAAALRLAGGKAP
jgi:anti-anti-sigma factor